MICRPVRVRTVFDRKFTGTASTASSSWAALSPLLLESESYSDSWSPISSAELGLRWLGRQQVALCYTCLEEESLLHVWCFSDEPRALWRLCHARCPTGACNPGPFGLCQSWPRGFLRGPCSWQFLLTQWTSRFLNASRSWRGLCVHRRLVEYWIFSLWIGEVLALELSSVAAR